MGAQKIDFSNLEIRFRPFLFELTDQNKVVDLAGTISRNMNLNLTKSKAGYNLSGITGSGGADVVQMTYEETLAELDVVEVTA